MVMLLKLTEDGVALGLKLHDKLHSYEANLVKGVPEGEIEALRSTIKKVLHNRNAMEQPAAVISFRPPHPRHEKPTEADT